MNQQFIENEESERFTIKIIGEESCKTLLYGEPSYEFASTYLSVLASKFKIQDGQIIVIESDLKVYTNALAEILHQYQKFYDVHLRLGFAKQVMNDQAAPEEDDIQELA